MEGVAAILIGFALGMACGGKPNNLSGARLRWEYLTLALFLLQAAVRSSIGLANLGAFAWYAWAFLASVLAVLLVAQESGALRLVATGMSLNVLVVLVNGGMPVWADALVAPRALETIVASGSFYAMADVRAALVILGDVLPAPWGALGSMGDMLLIVGVVNYIVIAMVAGSRTLVDS